MWYSSVINSVPFIVAHTEKTKWTRNASLSDAMDHRFCTECAQSDFEWNFLDLFCRHCCSKSLLFTHFMWMIAARLANRNVCSAYTKIRAHIHVLKFQWNRRNKLEKSIDLKLSTFRNKIDYYFVKCQITMLSCHFSSSTLVHVYAENATTANNAQNITIALNCSRKRNTHTGNNQNRTRSTSKKAKSLSITNDRERERERENSRHRLKDRYAKRRTYTTNYNRIASPSNALPTFSSGSLRFSFAKCRENVNAQAKYTAKRKREQNWNIKYGFVCHKLSQIRNKRNAQWHTGGESGFSLSHSLSRRLSRSHSV